MSVFWSNLPKPVLQGPAPVRSWQTELEEVKKSLTEALKEKDTCVAAAGELCPQLSECVEWKYTCGGLIAICALIAIVLVFLKLFKFSCRAELRRGPGRYRDEEDIELTLPPPPKQKAPAKRPSTSTPTVHRSTSRASRPRSVEFSVEEYDDLPIP